jgi:hypothetical protein
MTSTTSLTFTLDTTPPLPPVVSLLPEPTPTPLVDVPVPEDGPGMSMAFQLPVESLPASGMLTLYVDGAVVPSTYHAGSGVLTTLEPVSAGEHEFAYSVTTFAGDESDLISIATLTVGANPELPSIVTEASLGEGSVEAPDTFVTVLGHGETEYVVEEHGTTSEPQSETIFVSYTGSDDTATDGGSSVETTEHSVSEPTSLDVTVEHHVTDGSTTIDGGDGLDLLSVTDSGLSLDLSDVTGVEQIDLGSGNELSIGLDDVLSLPNETVRTLTMTVTGDATDSVSLGAGFTHEAGDTQVVNGVTFDVWHTSAGGDDAATLLLEQGVYAQVTTP